MFIDSHVHLEDERFNKDREEIIKNFENDGLLCAINVGSDLKTSKKSVEFADKYEKIYAVVGVHPHEVSKMTDDTLREIRELSKNKKVVAIGEIGLDYYYDNSPRDVQKEWFEKQIILAKELDLPIVIHSRDAAKDTLDIVKKHKDGLRGEMHCFSYSVEVMNEYLEMGFYIALGGAVTFKNARVPREVASVVPLDRLLLETDCPYLTPEPFRGKRNEPKYSRLVAEKIAEVRGISVDEIFEATNRNVKALFKC